MKNTKTVLILAAVTGALLLGGCGSEKTKTYEQAGKDLSQGSYKYALEEYQSSIQNEVKLAQSYRGAGIASLRLGKYEDAVNYCLENPTLLPVFDGTYPIGVLKKNDKMHSLQTALAVAAQVGVTSINLDDDTLHSIHCKFSKFKVCFRFYLHCLFIYV